VRSTAAVYHYGC